MARGVASGRGEALAGSCPGGSWSDLLRYSQMPIVPLLSESIEKIRMTLPGFATSNPNGKKIVTYAVPPGHWRRLVVDLKLWFL